MPQGDKHLRYEWGPLFKIDKQFPRTPESAAATAAELNRIQGNSPTLDHERIVEAAEPPESPIHYAFTWDDSIAARRWRLEQAGDLQRGLRMVIVRRDASETERKSPPAPVYASYRPEGGVRGTRELSVSLSDPVHRSALLDEAKAELARIRNRYQILTELAGVFEEIDRLL